MSSRGSSRRLRQLGKPHRSKIYPPFLHTAEEGHILLYIGVTHLELDVFAFMDDYMKK
ncbi:MAG TPA: hypothetical protein VLE22_25685 [Bryobacteraceae bacterium]|nr:hypothetical protein [Bryobacteraceae bacterium]